MTFPKVTSVVGYGVKGLRFRSREIARCRVADSDRCVDGGRTALTVAVQLRFPIGGLLARSRASSPPGGRTLYA